MSGAMGRQTFPRGALIGAAVLLGTTLAAVAAVRLTGPVSSIPPSSPVAVREFKFFDRFDGSIEILDARTGHTAMVLPPGGDYFIRATMRGLASERKREDKGAEIPFSLTRWADGRLTLTDPATSHAVELESFGATNEASFARLITAPGGTP